MNRRSSINTAQYQRGQSLVFVMALTIPIMLATLMLYKTGKLTSEKMQLQNAADAIAYSISTLEARDLNFSAYMNRAIVANEVGIGQMVGLNSWTNHYTSYGGFIHAIGNIIGLGGAVPILNIVPKITEKIKQFFDKSGGLLEEGSQAIAKVIIPITSNLNKVLGNAEHFYHRATAFVILESLFGSDGLIEQNAPGAKLSNFSKLTILAHLGSYLGKFSKSYDPTDTKDKEGFSRLASIIRASRDPFSVSRSPANPINLYLIPPAIGVQHAPAPVQLINIDFGFGVGPFRAELIIKLSFKLGFRLDHLGGSEIRFKASGGKTSAIGKKYAWTAADASEATIDIELKARIFAKLLGVTIIDESFTSPTLPGIGMGAGFSQAASKSANTLGKADLKNTPDTHHDFDVSDDNLSPLAYGAAASMGMAWDIGSAFPRTKPVVDRSSNTLSGYQGLPFYTGTAGVDEVDSLQELQILAPNILIGLVKPVAYDPATTNTVFNENSPRPNEAFRLMTEGEFEAASNEIAVIAKAEVYFKRSTDLATFVRGDGKEEFGNTFNPYWQSRLVNTSDADRMISLLAQQEVLWIAELETIEAGLINLAQNVGQEFDNLTSLFR